MKAAGFRVIMVSVFSFFCLLGCTTLKAPYDRTFFDEYQKNESHYVGDRCYDLLDVVSCSFEYPVVGAALVAGPLKIGLMHPVHTGSLAENGSNSEGAGKDTLDGFGHRCGQIGLYRQDEKILGAALDTLPECHETSRAVLRGKGRKHGEDAGNTRSMMFRIGAAAGIFGGARLEFNFGELADFILGFAGFDLMDDDLTKTIHGVSDLDLKQSELSVLSPKIAHLTDLRRLDVSENRLESLPPDMGKLRKLTELNAGHNRLKSYPAELCDLDYLAVLRLNGNDLKALPRDIKHLQALDDLDVSNNGLAQWPAALNDVRRLRSLNMRGNRMCRMPEDLGRLSSLEHLDLSENPLEHVPPALMTLKKLKTLTLNHGVLTDVPPDMARLTALKHLDLSFNRIERIDAGMLGKIPNLETLDLRGNPLSEDDMTNLYGLFGSHVRLDMTWDECMAKPRVLSPSTPEKKGKHIRNGAGMDFVYVEPGWFFMGSPEDECRRFTDELRHQVTLSRGFYIETREVTVGEWNAVMDGDLRSSSCGDCPVTDVSWNDAMAFIKKLNQREGHGKYRLPTEAEWEYACRAGSRDAFSFNEHLPASRAGYTGRPVKTGLLSPNAWGLFDMHGNAEEWCSDWYGDYSGGHSVDPLGPETGEGRVIRSSGFDSRHVRSAQRNLNRPDFKSPTLGFRLVRTP